MSHEYMHADILPTYYIMFVSIHNAQLFIIIPILSAHSIVGL